MQLVSDISANESGLDFLNACEAHFEIVSEKLSTELLSVVRQLKKSSLILVKSDKMLKETPFYFTKGRIFHDLFALAATMDGYICVQKLQPPPQPCMSTSSKPCISIFLT